MMVEALPKSLARLKELLENAVNLGGGLNPQQVKELVEQADVQEEDMKVYADFDHPIEDGYGRKLVYDGGKFEIMVMSWNPTDYSSIHNHGYTQWGVVQVFGNAHHFIYHEKEGELHFSKKEILTKGTITKVNNATIHQMGNPSSGKYMTLHIYGCNDKDCNITADAKNYELEFDRVNHTTGGAFFNLPEDQIYDFQPCPKPTDEVFVNYAKLLLDYYQRLEQTDEIKTLKNELLEKLKACACSN